EYLKDNKNFDQLLNKAFSLDLNCHFYISKSKMMNMVKNQLLKGKEALITSNKELALEVMHNEKRVNGYELLIDTDCENVIARFSPVAIDLRFVLATLKINYHLERIGDNADGIARNVLDLQAQWNEELLQSLELVKAFDTATIMLQHIIDSYANEDSSLARKVFEMDKTIDDITDRAIVKIADFLKQNNNNIEKDLYLLLIHRKLERVGDLMKNMAEEIIFYVEAKVLKHKTKIEKTQQP
ncbi:MAG: phosphate signaling complex protein PhoU, partial [Sphingobacteriales bacterium]